MHIDVYGLVERRKGGREGGGEGGGVREKICGVKGSSRMIFCTVLHKGLFWVCPIESLRSVNTKMERKKRKKKGKSKPKTHCM